MGGGLSKNGTPSFAHLTSLNDDELEQRFKKFVDGTTAKQREPSMSREALRKAMKEVHTAWSDGDVDDVMARVDTDADGHVTLDEFISAVRFNSTIEMLLRSLHIERPLAAELPAGPADNPLAGLRDMTRKDIVAAVQRAVEPIAEHLIAAREVAVKANAAVGQTGGKFAYELDGPGIDVFYGGVTDIVGEPRADLETGMRLEHCAAEDKDSEFSTGNYGVTTTPAKEYALVMSGGVGEMCEASGNAKLPVVALRTRVARRGDGTGVRDERCLRKISAYGTFDEDGQLETDEESDSDTPVQRVVKQAKLTRAEVIALVLYTGPMFQIYNGILRGFGTCGKVEEETAFGTDAFWKQLGGQTVKERVEESGNKYASTIHCLASAVKKLERVAECRQGERVYRGLGGGNPRNFAHGKGFTERGFMSTTRSLDVALDYSGVKKGLAGSVLAMELSEADRGADLSGFSQYPGEEEMLWNACSYVENLRGREEVHITKHGPVQVLMVKVNANGKAQTVEELLSRRKGIIVNMVETLERDVCRTLDDDLKEDVFHDRLEIERKLAARVNEIEGADYGQSPEEHLDEFIENIKEEVGQVVEEFKNREPAYYNKDSWFAAAVRSASAIPRQAVARVTSWTENRQVILASCTEQVCGMKSSEREGKRRVRARLAAARAKGDQEEVRRLALELSLVHGWVVDEESLNKPDLRGETPLESAAADGNIEAVQALLDAGASPEFDEDREALPVLAMAAMSGNIEVVRTLIDAGADINFEEDKQSPLYQAASVLDSDVMTLLVEHGAELDSKGDIVSAIVLAPNPTGRRRDKVLAVQAEQIGEDTELDHEEMNFWMKYIKTSVVIEDDEKAGMLESMTKIINKTKDSNSDTSDTQLVDE